MYNSAESRVVGVPVRCVRVSQQIVYFFIIGRWSQSPGVERVGGWVGGFDS